MWKYILTWTIVNIVTVPCSEKHPSEPTCSARHRSYNYTQGKKTALSKDSLMVDYRNLKRRELENTDTDQIKKVKLDSIFINN